jgi:hypothetical protein
VVVSLEPAAPMAPGDEHQRAVELVRLGQEERDIHRPGRRHVIVVVPGRVILVPLPDRAVKSRLGVDLELVHVELVGTEQLRAGLDQLRVAG